MKIKNLLMWHLKCMLRSIPSHITAHLTFIRNEVWESYLTFFLHVSMGNPFIRSRRRRLRCRWLPICHYKGLKPVFLYILIQSGFAKHIKLFQRKISLITPLAKLPDGKSNTIDIIIHGFKLIPHTLQLVQLILMELSNVNSLHGFSRQTCDADRKKLNWSFVRN